MNGAKHRFALGLTCFFLIGITVVYPFLLYTPNAFVTRWREWYIETAMGTMTHQWLATWFIPENIINEVMTKRYLMNQRQEGIVSNWDGAWEENEEDTAETPKDKFYAMFSELDESEFERFLADNPEYLENGYDEINIDLIGEPSQTHYDTGLKTKQGDTVLAVNAAHGILIIEQTGEDTLGMEYAGKIALCKKPENIYVGTSEGLGDYGSFVSDMVRDYDAILGINASGFADFDGNGTGGPGYEIKGEFSANGFKNDLKHTLGVLSMARTMIPDSAGSQFFIMVADAPHLDGQYAAFGKITENAQAAVDISRVNRNMYNDMPKKPQVIKTIRVDTQGVDYPEPEKM